MLIMRKSISNYLKTIYEASYAQDGTNNKQIATLLDVLPGSVTEAVGNLEKDGLVTRQKYHKITLTAAGYRLVQDLMYRYRLCEVWLHQAIELPLTEIPEQAWLMAAINDQELLRRLANKLGLPKQSPFGGRLNLPAFDQQPTSIQSLDQVPVDTTITLTSYLETSSLIKYFHQAGLERGQRLTVTGQTSTFPAITLMDEAQHEYMIDKAVARYLYVTG